MQLSKNEGAMDRFYRGLIGALLLIGAFFWLSGLIKIIFYTFGAYFALTASFGFCLIYLFLTHSSFNRSYEEMNKPKVKSLLIAIIIILIAGSITSHFWTKSIFLKDFADLNDDYKKVLFSAAQENREISIRNYGLFSDKLNSFYEKYNSYRPFVIKMDWQFGNSLNEIQKIAKNSKDKIYYGNLTSAYFELDSIRPILNDILRRNKLDSIKVSLVDFNEVLRIITDAAENKNPQEVNKMYYLTNEKLKDMEIKLNSTEVQLLRLNLDSLNDIAKRNELDKLPSKAQELKSSYLRVYMKYG
ncbi:MAG: DUF2892 domain-containing protein [Nanoarchaeota archaeon]